MQCDTLNSIANNDTLQAAAVIVQALILMIGAILSLLTKTKGPSK